MSFAEWIQLVAIVGTFTVVAVGVVFAALQLREEVHARRLQAISSLFAEVWPPEAAAASFEVLSLPADFKPEELTPEQEANIRMLLAYYNRVGYLLWQGLVKKHEILLYPAFGPIAVEIWVKTRQVMLNFLVARSSWFDYLVGQTQEYWKEQGGRQIAQIPVFEPDIEGLTRVVEEAQARRPQSPSKAEQ